MNDYGMRKVYTCDGHCLGDEWVDLSGLQGDTRKAVLQMIYLDQTVDKLSDLESERLKSESK